MFTPSGAESLSGTAGRVSWRGVHYLTVARKERGVWEKRGQERERGRDGGADRSRMRASSYTAAFLAPSFPLSRSPTCVIMAFTWRVRLPHILA